MSNDHNDNLEFSAGTQWDARAEYDLGLIIRRYLRDNPPPSDALFADALDLLSERLIGHGRARLDQIGAEGQPARRLNQRTLTRRGACTGA